MPVSGGQLEATPQGVTAAYLRRLVGDRPVRLGSRTSPMAMAQARQVAELLSGLVPGLGVEISGIQTDADQWQGDLAALGGKGAFTKTIDRALLMGEIDAAIHCMKDVPGDVPLPAGIAFAAYLPREDIRDCLVFPESSGRKALADLPAGARIGSCSVRRKAQLSRHRPDLAVHRVRGNVNSRLLRLDAGEFDALALARAGLARIGYADRAAETFDTDMMCPPVGAGVIGIQCRTDDKGLLELLRLLDDATTRTHVTAERVMLHGLQGHCNNPIAGHCATTPELRDHAGRAARPSRHGLHPRRRRVRACYGVGPGGQARRTGRVPRGRAAPQGCARPHRGHPALTPKRVSSRHPVGLSAIRSRAEVEALFAGWRLMPPGVVPACQWHSGPDEEPRTGIILGGVGIRE